MLDAQEAVTTERLASWRARADRWHADAECLDVRGAQKSRIGKPVSGSPGAAAGRSAGPPQQLVRPLLVIVAADAPAVGTPVAGKGREPCPLYDSIVVGEDWIQPSTTCASIRRRESLSGQR